MMKKLILIEGKTIAFLILLLCSIVLQSCRKETLMPNSPDVKNGISIAEAKAYFEKNIKKNIKSEKLMSVTGADKNINKEYIITNKKPIWNEAYEQLISTGKSVRYL